ncbi:MAG: hypothetical protein KBE42_04455, partial [Steroidobacteraceae bacterium]|nr:hypothetical protein [Steroidobacteraceae bacterium]
MTGRVFMTALIAAVTILGGCGGSSGGGRGGGDSSAACGETARKQFVLDATREWYLFPDLLPATVNASSFATAEELLD